MNDQQIDRWLDDDLDEHGMLQLENWLRNDHDHLQQHFDAVYLQEELRALYRASARKVTLPPIKSKSGVPWTIIVLSAAAVILLIAYLTLPTAGPLPTADPQLLVLAGNPLVEFSQTNPGPMPTPVSQDEWPTETTVTTAEKPSSLRWNKAYLVEVNSNTSLTLRRAATRFLANETPSIHLHHGGLTLKLAIVAAPIDILLNSSRVRVTNPTVFSLVDLGPLPEGPSIQLSVASGSVEVSGDEDAVRRVIAGESMLLQ